MVLESSIVGVFEGVRSLVGWGFGALIKPATCVDSFSWDAWRILCSLGVI